MIRFPQIVFLLLALTCSAGAEAPPDFAREVRPILSTYCFKCHGPDEKSRKGDLRLDSREAALQSGESGERAVNPGKPEESELIRRIFSGDRDELMPPPASKHELNATQKEILRKWIAGGAEYVPHWAFIAPRPFAPPSPSRPDWARNAIDHFILAKLDAERLSPASEADRITLMRRVHLDLTGLPPSPEEADAFLNDPAPDAYERLVDRLLASPHYGERWARKWLDLARYADTNGYEKDRNRNIWPYRDWVIRAFNDDMPFDQFTVRQLAGDLLPGATSDDWIATGFHRNTMLNEEGGIDPLEFRYYAMVDRTATTGTTWLGLTVGCAQCHTHKYDPLLHKEYFALMAFLDNADEPELDLRDANWEQQRARNLEKAAKLVAELPSKWPVSAPAGEQSSISESREEALEAAFAAWIQKEKQRTVQWTPLRPVAMKSNLPLLTLEPDASVYVSGDVTKYDRYELTFELPPGVTAIRIEALADDRLPGHGPGLAYYEGPKGDFLLSDLRLFAVDRHLKFSSATQSHAKDKQSAALAIDEDLQTGWACTDRLGESHQAVFVLTEPFEAGGRVTMKMEFSRHYAASLGRFRVSATTGSNAEARDLPPEVELVLAAPEGRMTASEREQLREQFLLTATELAAEAKKVREQRKPPGAQTTLVMRERPPQNPRITRMHHRGEWLQPGEEVKPGVPAFLPALPPGAPRSRLTFARWLVSPENPLTARVTVNRQWEAFFGQGLVRTSADFGFQGEVPSHPELLDWLALNFVQQGWSLMKLHRLIVTSATYRQDSRVTEQYLARDPQNRLLARGPRVRVDGELVRDIALQASGLLSRKMYGPPVRPPQPEGVSEVAYGAPKWKPSEGADRYRRALYTFAKRSAPYAMFNTFDAPSGEVCVARREVSNTPLQALTLLNDEVFLEAAQALGKQAAEISGTEEQKARFVFRRVLIREPRAVELEKLVAFARAQRERLEKGELDAKQLAKADSPEAAAWTALARAVLNVDETITKN